MSTLNKFMIGAWKLLISTIILIVTNVGGTFTIYMKLNLFFRIHLFFIELCCNWFQFLFCKIAHCLSKHLVSFGKERQGTDSSNVCLTYCLNREQDENKMKFKVRLQQSHQMSSDKSRDHVGILHWLPVPKRIQFKILTTLWSFIPCAPQSLHSLVDPPSARLPEVFWLSPSSAVLLLNPKASLLWAL